MLFMILAGTWLTFLLAAGAWLMWGWLAMALIWVAAMLVLLGVMLTRRH